MASLLTVAGVAAALATIPLLVHLLHRQQVMPIAWGAMQFLLATPLRVKRRRRIDNWLLMLIRMAILAAIVALLARPVIKNTRLIGSAPIDVAIVIDHSLSMGKHIASTATAGGAAPAGGAALANSPSAGTLFEEAVNTAEKLARMIPPGGTISIVLAEHQPNNRTAVPIKVGFSTLDANGEPKGEWAHVLQMLRQMRPGMTKADIPAAVQVARDLVSHGYNTRKMVLILSDDQRSNWYPGNDTKWMQASGSGGTNAGEGPPDESAIRTTRIPIYSYPLANAAGADLANVSVRGITVTPAFLGVHRPVAITAEITNSGGAALSNIPVQLFVDGRPIITQTLPALDKGATENMRFDHYFSEAGSHWLQIHADVVDALEADNTATAAVTVNPRLPVLIVDGQLTAAAGTGGNFLQSAYLAAAMQPVDPAIDPTTLIEPRIISVAQIAARGATASTGASVRIEDYPVVVLNDVPRLPRETIDRLTEHVERGNGVWIILGPRTEEQFVTDVLGKSTLFPLAGAHIARAPLVKSAGAENQAPRPALISMDVRVPNNPSVSALMASDQNSLAGVTLRQWWDVIPGAAQMRTIIATTSPPATDAPAEAPATAPAEADPLALELEQGKSGGRVILWTTPASTLEWNNLPWVPNFTPLVNETLFHLASGLNASQPRQLNVGAPLAWTGPASLRVQAATLDPPDGPQRGLLPQLHGDSLTLRDTDTNLPGLYTLRFVMPAAAGVQAPPPVYYSVNIDPDELRADVVTPADLDWFKKQGHLAGVLNEESLPKALDAQQGGQEIWWIIGLLLLLFLILEVFMTRNLARQQAGSTLADSGLAVALPPSARFGEPVGGSV